MKRQMLGIITGCMVALSATALLAANGLPGAPSSAPLAVGTRHRGGWMAALNQVGLSSSQQRQVNTIMANVRSQLGATKTNTAGAKQQRRTIMHAARQQIVALLTPSQKARLKSILEANRAAAKA